MWWGEAHVAWAVDIGQVSEKLVYLWEDRATVLPKSGGLIVESCLPQAVPWGICGGASIKTGALIKVPMPGAGQMSPGTEPWAVVMVVVPQAGLHTNKGYGALVSGGPSLAGWVGLPTGKGQVCDVGDPDPGRVPLSCLTPHSPASDRPN